MLHFSRHQLFRVRNVPVSQDLGFKSHAVKQETENQILRHHSHVVRINGSSNVLRFPPGLKEQALFLRKPEPYPELNPNAYVIGL